MLHKRVFIFLALLFLTNELLAQANCNVSFSGIVIDNHDDKPLVGAVVQFGNDQVAVTDENGKFSFVNLCADEYELTISHIDCEPFEQTITLNQSIEKVVYLEHHEQYIEEITIESERRKAELSKGNVIISSEEIKEKRGKAFGNLLEQTTGVSLLKTGSTISKPIINGLHSQRIVTVNRGVRLEGQQWGLEHAPGIDSYSVNDIEIIKGAGTVEYGGDALGGVILVDAKHLPDTYGFQVDPTVAFHSNGRSVSGNIHLYGKEKIVGIPLSYQAQASMRTAGNLRAPDYYLDNTGGREKNFFVNAGYIGDEFGLEAKVSQFTSDLGILTDSHIGNRTDLLAIIENGQPFVDRGFSTEIQNPKQNILHEIIDINSYYQTGFGKFEATVSRQYNRRKEFDRYEDIPGLNLKTETYAGALKLNHELGNNWEGKIGIDGQFQTYQFDGFYLLPEYEFGQFGAFLAERYQFSNELIAEAGIRWDAKEYRFELPHQSFSEVDESAIEYRTKGPEIGIVEQQFSNLWSGSVGFSYDISQQLRLGTYFGVGVRQPLPNELFSDGVHHGTALYEVGNPSLELEQSYSNQLNVDVFTDQWSANFHGYLNTIQDYIYSRPTENLETKTTIRGEFPIHQFTQNDVAITGFDYEVTPSIRSDLFQFTTTGSFLWGTNKDDNEALIYMPQNQILQSVQFQAEQNWTLGADLQTVFTQKRIPESIPDYGTIPTGYSLLNLDGTYATELFAQPIDLRLSVENVFNTTYKNYLDRFRYFAAAPGINFGLQINYSIN